MTWMDVLISVIDTVADILLTAVLPFAFMMLQQKIKNNKASEYITMAEKYLIDAVGMVKQTFVDSLKAEGKFDREAQTKAFDMAKTTWLNMMSEEMKKVVLNEIGDIETWVTAKLETAVIETKK